MLSNFMFILEFSFLLINESLILIILSLLKDEITLKDSFSATEPKSFLDEPQQDLPTDDPQYSRTFFSSGISNNTKGLDKSKEQNSLQTFKSSISLIF